MVEQASYPVICEVCTHKNLLKVNLFNGKSEQVRTEAAIPFRKKWQLVVYFKVLKGYDKLPSWDSVKSNKARAIKAATEILQFFSPTSDPLTLAMECMDETHIKAKKEGWFWTMETIVKIAPEWILAKQKSAEARP